MNGKSNNRGNKKKLWGEKSTNIDAFAYFLIFIKFS